MRDFIVLNFKLFNLKKKLFRRELTKKKKTKFKI